MLPEETDALSIEPGQDYATLVTCTPYAINTHRLLVRGERIPYEEAIKEVPDQSIKPGIIFYRKSIDHNNCSYFNRTYCDDYL